MHLFIGPDCILRIVKKLKELAYKLNKIFTNPLPMKPLTEQGIETFNKSTYYHIRSKCVLPTHIKIKDHNDLNGHYECPPHNTCNINYQNETFVRVIYHNLSGYGSFIECELSN